MQLVVLENKQKLLIFQLFLLNKCNIFRLSVHNIILVTAMHSALVVLVEQSILFFLLLHIYCGYICLFWKTFSIIIRTRNIMQQKFFTNHLKLSNFSQKLQQLATTIYNQAVFFCESSQLLQFPTNVATISNNYIIKHFLTNRHNYSNFRQKLQQLATAIKSSNFV